MASKFRCLTKLIQPISPSFLQPKPSSFFSLHSKPLLYNTNINNFNNLITNQFIRTIHLESLSSLAPKPFDPLTDSRFCKRRPSLSSRPKRSTLRPSGPYAWVKYTPGEPVPPSQPNQGSVKLRNEKKRRRQHREFIKAERKKRMAQLKEANRKKREKRIERKMEAVARDREWAERLAELQRLEAEKKKTAS